MTILLTGANGQVGQEFVLQMADRQLNFHAFDHQQCDITDSHKVTEAFTTVQPQLVINCAAYTAVDMAENNLEHCFAVNRDGVAVLAEACAKHHVPIIHFSTDYVFDGKGQQPYREDDAAHPLGVYGDSKWQGEEALRKIHVQHLIIRLSWVNGSHGPNFMKTMINLARTQDKLRVVADQQGCPTFSVAIAQSILDIIPQLDQQWGTYHFCQGPATTWYEFASEVIQVARHYTSLRVQEIEAITTEDFPTPAKRPAYSVLSTEKFQQTFQYDIPDWRTSLHRTLHEFFR